MLWVIERPRKRYASHRCGEYVVLQFHVIGSTNTTRKGSHGSASSYIYGPETDS